MSVFFSREPRLNVPNFSRLEKKGRLIAGCILSRHAMQWLQELTVKRFTWKPFKLCTNDCSLLSPQFDHNDQWFHSCITLGVAFQKEGVSCTVPVLYGNITFKRLLLILECDYGNFGIWYNLKLVNFMDIVLCKI